MNKEKEHYSVLFIEDEHEIRKNYVTFLKSHFINVYEAGDGEEGYKVYKEKKPEILIIDINIPKLNGIELIKKIRIHDQKVKIIILSAYSEVKYLMQAIELKLVKYLVKPITRGELKEALDLAIKEFSKFDIFHKKVLELSNDYVWNFETKSMFCKAEEIAYTNKEKKIMTLLFSNPNKVFTYDDIIEYVWDFSDENKYNALKTLIKNIRKKLPNNIIKNVFGIGYKY